MSKTSPTAYAILGLLAARPWSAYELARHMRTSSNLRQIWPRAESKIYQAPKTLVAEGWATSREKVVSGRSRTIYRITDKGRHALESWLDEEAAPPRIELESALKVAYATAGSIEQLRRNLQRIRSEQLAMAGVLSKTMTQLREQGFSIPERAHTSALVSELVRRISKAMGEWAEWAEGEIEHWDDLEPDTIKETWARAIYDQALLEAEEFVAKHGDDTDMKNE